MHPSLKVEVLGKTSPRFNEVLTKEALNFVAEINSEFAEKRQVLLEARATRQEEINRGRMPDFLRETAGVRTADWRVGSIPDDLQDRRVEITGPAGDAKMVINAFNSGANVYMSDFEDSLSPTWEQVMQGQVNLKDAVDGALQYRTPEGKEYKLDDERATLTVRPRGWHLLERHVKVDGHPVSGSLFDFGLFLFHNAKKLVGGGTGPYFYLPKLESHLEARLWNDVFLSAEQKLGMPVGTIKATVLIETVLAAFEMDEILYELRQHAVGLNCGRWDYIFSFVKKFRNSEALLLPDRAQVTMDKAFLASYVRLAIQTCHRRGAHAIGGMSAYIPVKGDEEANRTAFEQVRIDKEREVKAGHDGTWVAHPGLVKLAKEVFDENMKTSNQVSRKFDETAITAEDLLRLPAGTISPAGLRTNISVGIQYLEAWLRGKGSVPINHLMEDMATAEICRAQVWQWARHGVVMSDGTKLTAELIGEVVEEELAKLHGSVEEAEYTERQYSKAGSLFESVVTSKEFVEFLTIPAYVELLSLEGRV